MLSTWPQDQPRITETHARWAPRRYAASQRKGQRPPRAMDRYDGPPIPDEVTCMLRLRVGVVLLVLLATIAPLGSSAGAGSARAGPTGAGVDADLAGILLVGMRQGIAQVEAQDLFQQNVLGRASVVRVLPRIGVQVVRVRAGQEAAWLAHLRADSRVAFAERDHRVHAAGPGTGVPSAADMTGGALPNDPALSRQWSLSTIHAPEAWQHGTGSSDVVIAVVDSGIAVEHPDLADKLWVNAGEIAGNGYDDDGNGKVDDMHGWHFYHNDTGIGYEPAEDADIADEHGHGTHVAGIAAAATNNGVGIAGVSWGARLMTLKTLDHEGNGWYSDVAAAVIYAADNGGGIINLSLGGSQASDTLCAAVEYAHGRGSLVVAAAGNSGGAVLYPAACPGALAVAATDSADQRVSTSNQGPEVDIAAPGVGIYSTWHGPDGYYTQSGTSMAAPHVSGVAALVWSRWPALGPDEITRQLTRTAIDIEATGFDWYTGWGRVDAARATAALWGGQRVFLPLVGCFPLEPGFSRLPGESRQP